MIRCQTKSIAIPVTKKKCYPRLHIQETPVFFAEGRLDYFNVPGVKNFDPQNYFYQNKGEGLDSVSLVEKALLFCVKAVIKDNQKHIFGQDSAIVKPVQKTNVAVVTKATRNLGFVVHTFGMKKIKHVYVTTIYNVILGYPYKIINKCWMHRKASVPFVDALAANVC